MLLAKHECTNENEFKILLRSIIIGLLIFCENSEIILGINENIKKLLFDFSNNFSNRKKIDSDFYLELLFIENFLDYNEIRIIDSDEKEYRILNTLRKETREILKDKTVGLEEKVTNAIWKNEILNSENLNDLFMYNYKKEFDWKTTLEFVSNRINFTQRQCSNKDTKERSYRIKNLLKEQPTYKILYKRNTNKIENEICIRCGKNEEEDWNIFGSAKITNSRLMKFLSNKKEEKSLIKRLWMFTYDEIKNRLWIPLCEEIKRLEEKANIQKLDLRKKRERQEDKTEDQIKRDKKTKTEENLEKLNKKRFNKKISLVTLGKLTGSIVDGNSIANAWE
ncbi:hypothetical protein GLOIN_2v1771092 [Rhizophagus irregularis DAOM 181602=DAOM 197198]|nr:hypothetical protein GLOIN_2v1771092 [Rhizophagus irregularis DAOM 181602=DAOM 197198]